MRGRKRRGKRAQMSGVWKGEGRRISDGDVNGWKGIKNEWGGSIKLGKGKGRRAPNMMGWIHLCLFLHVWHRLY